MSDSKSSGIGVLSVLGIVFITLKLLGKINWSWWYVTVPLWGPLAVLLAILVLVTLLAALAAMIT